MAGGALLRCKANDHWWRVLLYNRLVSAPAHDTRSRPRPVVDRVAVVFLDIFLIGLPFVVWLHPWWRAITIAMVG